MAFVPISINEGVVAFVPVTVNEGGVAFVPINSNKKVWPFCLSV